MERTGFIIYLFSTQLSIYCWERQAGLGAVTKRMAFVSVAPSYPYCHALFWNSGVELSPGAIALKIASCRVLESRDPILPSLLSFDWSGGSLPYCR